MQRKIKKVISVLFMLILAVFVTYVYFYWLARVEIVKIAVPRGAIKMVTLPDSSEVVLNAESSLKYDKNEWPQKREVLLTGEAFFKIKIGKPFFVKSEKITTKTFGAKFNIKLRENKIKVSCISGKVTVNTNQIARTAVVLEPGNTTSLMKNDVLETPRVFDMSETIGWLSGEMLFKNTPLLEVFAELERQFNIFLHLKRRVRKLTFTGRIQKSDLNYALDFIGLASGLKFDAVNDSTYIVY